MGLGRWFSRLPPQVSRLLHPALRYANLMRAIEMHHLAPWTQQVEGKHILDVGCGHGLYSMAFALRGATLLGCDLSMSDLAAASRTARAMGLGTRAAYAFADGSRLPVPENTFDLVVCNCVLEHIIDDDGALAAMYQSLKPDGLLYLSVDNADHALALGFLERLPPKAKALLLRPEVANAPTVAQGFDDYLGELYAVQRRYHSEELRSQLMALGFQVLAERAYLASLGAAHYEVFHLFRGMDPQRGLGRLAHMFTSVILYPFAIMADRVDRQQGYGLAFVARKGYGPEA